MTLPDQPRTVTALVNDSIVAHLAYREALRKKQPAVARGFLQTAQEKRLQAHEQDPEHIDAIWAVTERTHPHKALLIFYAEQLQ